MNKWKNFWKKLKSSNKTKALKLTKETKKETKVGIVVWDEYAKMTKKQKEFVEIVYNYNPTFSMSTKTNYLEMKPGKGILKLAEILFPDYLYLAPSITCSWYHTNNVDDKSKIIHTTITFGGKTRYFKYCNPKCSQINICKHKIV